MQTVRILKGFWRGKDIVNTTFPLTKEYKIGRKGGYITVDGAQMGEGNMRILVEPANFELLDGPVAAAEPAAVETVDEAIARIAERFEILEEMTAAAQEGVVRGMIVSGPPGVGKSFGVEKVLEQDSMMTELAGLPKRYDIVKGSTSAIGLYQMLYRSKDEGNVLVLDDCDSILFDENALNILKAALDSGKKRTISWMSESHVLQRADVPDRFEFKGSVIFITNLKFDNARNTKIKDHLEAIMSRCHYLDLTLDTERDKILRIKQVMDNGGIFANYGFSKEEKEEVMQFIEDNAKNLREISLRMAGKIADLKVMSPKKWQALAKVTCMKRN